jgi:hypothetical protein
MKTYFEKLRDMTSEEVAEARRTLFGAITAPSPLWAYFEGQRNRVRPRNSAGVAAMARLMQRTRDERDFGGAVDED